MPKSVSSADLPLVSPMDRALFLRAQPYFAGLEGGIIATLATHAEERFLRPGEWFHHEGEPVDRIAFLSEGQVSLMRGDEVLREIEAPGGIGVVPALAGTRWTPGIVATEPTVYLEVARREFEQILEDRFPLVLQLAAAIVRERPALVVRGAQIPGEDHDTDIVGRIVAAGRNPVFEEMNLIALVELLREGLDIELAPGELFTRRKGDREAMTLVLGGALRSEADGQQIVANAGDLIGLDGLFHHPASGAHFEATRPTRLLSIPRLRYFDLLEDHHEAAQAVLRTLTRRVLDSWAGSER